MSSILWGLGDEAGWAGALGCVFDTQGCIKYSIAAAVDPRTTSPPQSLASMPRTSREGGSSSAYNLPELDASSMTVHGSGPYIQRIIMEVSAQEQPGFTHRPAHLCLGHTSRAAQRGYVRSACVSPFIAGKDGGRSILDRAEVRLPITQPRDQLQFLRFRRAVEQGRDALA
jgi:hypothetical protein